ncbi:uncharacterized protein LOC62_05G007241 [Vanrija pseudolonga]|uniref:Monopolin complex subunit Csm1/Pcs1 C-terminal domain-containing protein n=1 Tax=Vanrija pseudolonga TaxID=143232 RepID=A0AAF0YBK5_9TREE|nr:hypothetical protein LOC62_05G007241 [Vanrija pseudolonga]
MPPAAKATTKRGKENVAPSKASKAAKVAANDDELAGDDFDAMDVEPVKEKPKVGRPPKAAKVAKQDASGEEEERGASEPAEATGTVNKSDSTSADRLRRERDTFAKQFEELSRLRLTESEAVFERYKERAAAKAKAQADLIESLSALNEKQANKVAELEKALAASQVAAERAAERAAQASAPPVLDAKLDSKGVKELRDEVFKLRNTIKAKDEQMTTLQRDYDAEVEHSRSLQSQRASSANPPAPAPNSEEAEKDQLSVRLYEDISGLAILNINVKQTNAGKEVICNCLQTSIEGRSFGFKLRTYNEYDKRTKKWGKMVEMTPEGLKNEKDKAFVARLGPFASGFIIPVDQLASAWEQLRARMSDDGVFEDVPTADA